MRDRPYCVDCTRPASELCETCGAPVCEVCDHRHDEEDEDGDDD